MAGRPRMIDGRLAFEYAVIRVVPRVERGECMNAGVLLYCRARDYLGASVMLDPHRLAALDPRADPDQIQKALHAATDCTLQPGDNIGRRFRWLTAPRSTAVQPGPIHTGLTTDPRVELARLMTVLVEPPPSL